MPVLDLAHSVFNAVLGVSAKGERSELRAFRPVAEWIEIVQACGLSNSSLYVFLSFVLSVFRLESELTHLLYLYRYEMEKGDPTVDEMLCFVNLTVSVGLPFCNCCLRLKLTY